MIEAVMTDAPPPPPAAASIRQSYVGLDIVRFMAALSVVLYHLGYFHWYPQVTAIEKLYRDDFWPLSPIFRWGWAGVPVFFTLSGFVIALSATGKSAVRFVESRFLRLYPAAWICSTITLAIIGADKGHGLVRYVNSMILWPLGPWVSGVYWTLGVEMMFYVAVGVTMVLGISLFRLAVVIGSLSSLYWFGRAADFLSGGHWKDLFGFFEQGQWQALTLLPHGCFFAVGMLLFQHSRHRSAGIALLLGIFLSASLVSLLSSGHFFVASQGGGHLAILVPAAIWACGLGAMILSVYDVLPSLGASRRAHMVARSIGLMTYPLYLVHDDLGVFLMNHLSALGGYALILAVVAVVGVSFLVVVVETSLRSRLTRLTTFRSLRPPASLRRAGE